MAVNLVKGQKIDLTKGNPGLSNIMVGLGWDPIKKSGGLLGGLFNSVNNQNIDCDASVILLDANQKYKEVVYFGNLNSSNKSVTHTGDNITGDGDGDDEQILVDLNKIPSDINRLIFVVNIYKAKERKQHFGLIANAFIRIVDQTGRKELLRFNLTDDYSNMTALFAGELYRHNSEWKFAAIGEGTTDNSLTEMVKRYR